MFENKMIVSLCRIVCLQLVVSFFSGCKTDYTDDAVENARNYAINQLHDITESQRMYIRYSQPKIYENTLFVKTVNEIPYQGHLRIDHPTHLATAPYLDFMHSCMVWCPPDMDGMIVVAGEGERSMRGWSPNNVQVKRYVPVNTSWESAMRTCSLYAMNTMLYLSDAELNRVRFSEPEFVYTSFPVVEEKKAQDNADDIEWNDSDKKNNEDVIQQSLVWPGDNENTKIVFYGTTKSGGIYQWKLIGADIMSDERVNKHRLSEQECKKIKVIPDSQQLTFPSKERLIRTNRQNRKKQGFVENLMDVM